MTHNRKAGFTLLEIVLTIALLLAVLSMTLLRVQWQKVQARSDAYDMASFLRHGVSEARWGEASSVRVDITWNGSAYVCSLVLSGKQPVTRMYSDQYVIVPVEYEEDLSKISFDSIPKQNTALQFRLYNRSSLGKKMSFVLYEPQSRYAWKLTMVPVENRVMVYEMGKIR